MPAEAVTLEISGLSHEGRGIAHINGKVAFVDGALPGETVSAKYVRNRSQFSEFKAEEILTPAAQRVPLPVLLPEPGHPDEAPPRFRSDDPRMP